MLKSIRAKILLAILAVTMFTAGSLTVVFYLRAAGMIEENYSGILYGRMQQTVKDLDESLKEIYYVNTRTAWDEEIRHLFIATPPLYKIVFGGKNYYALDDEEKDKILSKAKANQKPDISRFKGLGEMSALQLKETTMDKNNRVLLRVVIPTANTEEARDEAFETRRQVERLMGKDPEQRFKFIIERAKFAEDLDI